MNKWLLKLASILMVIGLLIGCNSDDKNSGGTSSPNSSPDKSSETTNADEENEEIVLITISKDKGEEIISEKDVSIKNGDLLLDVMRENFKLEEGEGGFITSIDGIEQDVDAGIGWMYSVNGEIAAVGAAEFELSPGDKVNFDLQPWE